MRFLFPAPTSLAKCSKANEKTSAPTVPRWVAPASKPLRSWGVRRRREVVGPLVTLVNLHQRPFSNRGPDLSDDRLEPQAMFILAPQLYLRRWVALLEPQYPHREPYLKKPNASNASAVCMLASDVPRVGRVRWHIVLAGRRGPVRFVRLKR